MTIGPRSVVITALWALAVSIVSSALLKVMRPVGVSPATGESSMMGAPLLCPVLPMPGASPTAARLKIIITMNVT